VTIDEPRAPRSVVVVLFDRVELLDVFGPLELRRPDRPLRDPSPRREGGAHAERSGTDWGVGALATYSLGVCEFANSSAVADLNGDGHPDLTTWGRR
jgi:FG-GAP repeat